MTKLQMKRKKEMAKLRKKSSIIVTLLLMLTIFMSVDDWKVNASNGNEVIGEITTTNYSPFGETVYAAGVSKHIAENVTQAIEEEIVVEEETEEICTTPQTVYKYNISDEDRLFFEQIVSAETYEFWTVEECLAIASVIINRVETSKGGFANVNTIREVCAQPLQFEVYSNGRYLTVPVSDSARTAVELALQGKTNLDEDILFFCTKEYYNGAGSNTFFKRDLPNPCMQIRNVYFFKPE